MHVDYSKSIVARCAKNNFDWKTYILFWYNVPVTSKKLAIPFEYMDTPERRVLSLEQDGFPCIPVLGLSRYCSTRPFLDAHRHPECIEISLCVRAPLAFECEGKTYRLMPGQLFVTQPSDLHHLVTNPKGLFLYWIFFRLPRKGQSVLGLISDESKELVNSLRQIPHRLFPAIPEVKSLFIELFAIHDARMSRPARRLAYRVTLLRLLNRIAASASRETTLSADKRLYAVVTAIKENPRQRSTVPELAAKAFMSESVFNSRFKKLTGYPPHAYIAKCRLDAIKELLTQGKTSISQIAADFGYHSPQHLAGQFKATFGMTMSEWRSGWSTANALDAKSARLQA